VITALREAFREPTIRQKEAYGRFAHTLAAAAVIGAVTFLFSELPMSVANIVRIAGLTVSGLVFFAFGAILCKGE